MINIIQFNFPHHSKLYYLFPPDFVYRRNRNKEEKGKTEKKENSMSVIYNFSITTNIIEELKYVTET